MTENMNQRIDRTEFAPTVLKNAVTHAGIQELRIQREITSEIVDAARTFNKVLGKISHDEAYDIFEHIDFKHYVSYETVLNAVNGAFDNQPEDFYRVDGIVSRIQVQLVQRGVKDISW